MALVYLPVNTLPWACKALPEVAKPRTPGYSSEIMINRVRAVCYNEMQDDWRRHLANPHTHLVSVIDTKGTVILPLDAPRTITLRFDDIAADDPRPLFGWERAMTADQAAMLVDFLDEVHEKPRACEVVINCTAGVSRSGAIATFCLERYKPFGLRFREENPNIKPNQYVLRLLKEQAARKDARG